METKRNGPAVRTAVTKLLRRYFDDLRTRLSAGTSEFWNTMEQRLSQTPDAPTGPREKQTRQPEQQQQAKAEDKP